MKKNFLFSLLTLFSTLSATSTVDLDSIEGEARLMNSYYSNDYWALNNHYLSQKARSCGVGSAVMVLNALDIYRPPVDEYFGYTLFTPATFLTSVEKVITQEQIQAGLMNAKILAESLKLFSLDAQVIPANTLDAEKLRTFLKEHLNDSQSFLIANYYRPSLGHKGKGNFSPIGAYDEASDSVLLLDPLRDQYGPFWAPLGELLLSMQEKDNAGETRALLVVKRQYQDLYSEKGIARIKESRFAKDYFKLSRYFETQQHWTYCAVASSVAVMNAFLDKVHFTQDNFFTPETRSIVTPEEVQTNWRGITADELVQILSIHGFSATFTSANLSSVDLFRDLLTKVLNDPKLMVIANYNRPEAGQVGGGHFSPIVAYDQNSDSLLIMDTSRYKYPPVWIDITTFFNAMHTKDSDGLFRGYLTIGSSIHSKDV